MATFVMPALVAGIQCALNPDYADNGLDGRDEHGQDERPARGGGQQTIGRRAHFGAYGLSPLRNLKRIGTPGRSNAWRRLPVR
jgi:hypothetical protein